MYKERANAMMDVGSNAFSIGSLSLNSSQIHYLCPVVDSCLWRFTRISRTCRLESVLFLLEAQARPAAM